MLTQFHFAEDAFTLHLLFQGFKRLIDIVVADQNLHGFHHPSSALGSLQPRMGHKTG